MCVRVTTVTVKHMLSARINKKEKKDQRSPGCTKYFVILALSTMDMKLNNSCEVKAPNVWVTRQHQINSAALLYIFPQFSRTIMYRTK